MKKPWFREVGWMYVPVSAAGVVATILVLAFCLQVFLAVDARSHSITDTLYAIFPFVVPSIGILFWVASKTSKKKT